MFDASLFGSKLTRRDFMKTITALTAVMGLPATMVPRVAEAAEAGSRPPVIWLHFQECTGCTTSTLRATHPSISTLLLDLINLEYHETLMAGSGHQAEKSLVDAIKNHKDKYILVCEGAVPLANEAYCMIGGRSAKDLLDETAASAMAVVSLGTCASLGGVQAAAPNPTGASSVSALVDNKPVINLPGCPPNPYNLASVLLYFLTLGKFPELDSMGRPMFAYGRLIHDHCERRSHFDAGRFAKAFGDKGHALGYCLYELGCKGPATYANCSTLRFNDGMAWPVSIGHPCVGCTEHLIFNTAIADKVQIVDPGIPSWFPPAKPEVAGKPAKLISGVTVGLATGAALGYVASRGKGLSDEEQDKE